MKSWPDSAVAASSKEMVVARWSLVGRLDAHEGVMVRPTALFNVIEGLAPRQVPRAGVLCMNQGAMGLVGRAAVAAGLSFASPQSPSLV